MYNYREFKNQLEYELSWWFDHVELSIKKDKNNQTKEVIVFKDDEDMYYRYLIIDELFELYLYIDEDLEFLLEQLLDWKLDELPIYFDYS